MLAGYSATYGAVDDPPDGASDKFQCGYDGEANPILTIDPLGRRTTLTWDPAGRPAERTDPRGIVAGYQWDPADQLVGMIYSDGTRVTASYDAGSRLQILEDTVGQTLYGYDPVDRLVSTTPPGLSALLYRYDLDGNRVGRTASDGGRTTYAYDLQGRPVRIDNPYGETTTLGYDALSREVQRVLANGVVVSRAFDAGGRRTVLQQYGPAGALLLGFTASYDAVDNPLCVQEPDGSQVSYSYDAAYRLLSDVRTGTGAYAVSYAYDPDGNRLQRADAGGLSLYSYDAADQLLARIAGDGTRTTFQWDGNGNLAAEVTGANRTSYTWDAENRLLGLQFPDGARETLTYCAYGLRHFPRDRCRSHPVRLGRRRPARGDRRCREHAGGLHPHPRQSRVADEPAEGLRQPVRGVGLTGECAAHVRAGRHAGGRVRLSSIRRPPFRHRRR